MVKGKRETAPLWITEVCQTEVATARTREELEEDIKRDYEEWIRVGEVVEQQFGNDPFKFFQIMVRLDTFCARE